MNSESNWITATGQIWKLYIALAGFLGTLACFTLALYSLTTGGHRLSVFSRCGLVLGIATFIWMTLALRCPHCHAKLVWTMVATRPHSSWLIDLASLEQCPVCGRTMTDRR